MHIDQEPVIDESHADVLAGDTIHVDLVHPQGVALAYQTPEGSHSNFPGEVYTGRLQAATQETEGQLRYLTVIRGAEAAESVANIAASSEEVVGVLSGSDLVLFPRTTVSGEADELSVEVSGDVEKVWWTGLEPNTEYSVEKNGSRITLSKGGSLLSDEAGIVVW